VADERPFEPTYPQETGVGGPGLKGHPADFNRRLLYPLDWNKLPGDADDQDSGAHRIGPVNTEHAIVIPDGVRADRVFKKPCALCCQHLANELLLSTGRVLIYPIQCFAKFLFDKVQITIRCWIRDNQAYRHGEAHRQEQ
jgi:hypothetical protein